MSCLQGCSKINFKTKDSVLNRGQDSGLPMPVVSPRVLVTWCPRSLAWSPGSSCAGPEAGLQLTAVWAGVISQLQRLQAVWSAASVCSRGRAAPVAGGRCSQRDLHSVTVYNPASILLLSHKLDSLPSFNISREAKLFDTHESPTKAILMQ